MTAPAPGSYVRPAGDATRSPAGALSPAHPRLRVAARLAYVVIILFATLPGTGWSAEPRLVRLRLARALQEHLTSSDVVDGVRNVVLFAGLGVVWIATTRTRRLWPPVWRATAGGALLSFLVETTQLTSPTRFASVLDLATNTAGAFLGALAAAVVVRFTRWELEHGASEMPTLLVAASYLGAGALEAFSPLGPPDVLSAGGGLRERLGASLAFLGTAPPVAPSLLDVLLFAPAGAVVAAALLAYGWRSARATVGAVLLCTATFATGELMRGMAGSDMRPRALALRVAAAAVGAIVVAVARRPRPVWLDRRAPLGTRRETPLWLAGAALLLLVLWYWRPFSLREDFGADFTLDNLVPLRALRVLFTIYAVADVGVDFLLFFPLGIWLTVHPLRRDGALRGVLPALWLSVVLECGQLWVKGRTFDVTDLLVQWAAVLVGAAVVTQARLRVRRERRRGVQVAAPPAVAQSAVG